MKTIVWAFGAAGMLIFEALEFITRPLRKRKPTPEQRIKWLSIEGPDGRRWL
jgi:hypothetical protein